MLVDGIPVSTPRTFTGVEGFQRELSAPSAAVAQDGTVLQFAGWSDGKSIRHLITTPADDTTYTATYQPSQPFTAQYYDNTTFSGTPVLTRQDPNINFVWGDGSPDPALPTNGFSVRWTKTQHFGAGRYRFTAVADDGVRLYIDGRRVINQWAGPGERRVRLRLELGEGKHTIKMEYVEHGGGRTRVAQLGQRADQPTGTCPAQYWNMPPGVNAIPGTRPELARDEDDDRPRLGRGLAGRRPRRQPLRGRLDAHLELRPRRLRVRRHRRRRRAAVRRRRARDRQVDRPGADDLPHDAALDGGPHKVVIEYYENGGGAVAQLGYAAGRRSTRRDRVPRGVLEHPGRDRSPAVPTGPADLERNDDTLDFDWGDGSPGAGIAADRFVAALDEDGGALGGALPVQRRP